MPQAYCPACLTVVTDDQPAACAACGEEIPGPVWPVTTTFRYPWLGYIVDRRYRLVQYLGYGGTGDVYRAECLSVGVSFAAKVIDRRIIPAARSDEDLAQRLNREVAAMAAVSSPHVTRVIDYFIMPEDIFVMLIEFAPGKTLEHLIQEQGRLDPPVALEIARQVLEALAELDSLDLVHRDLKPENLMVQLLPSERPFVRLLDFGIVKKMEGTRITEGFVGTPHFAAPEQAVDAAGVDGRSDLYSLGCILFYMLTGTVPFPGNTPVAILNDHLHTPVPLVSERLGTDLDDPELEQLVGALMAKAAVDRPSSAKVLLVSPIFRRRSAPRVAPGPDGVRMAAPVTLTDTAFGRPGYAAARHTARLKSSVELTAVSPKCRTAASLTRAYELIVWNLLGSVKARRRPLPPKPRARFMFFSRDGAHLIVSSSEGRISALNPETLQEVHALELPPSAYRWIGPSRVSNSRILAVTAGSIAQWHLERGLQDLVEGELCHEVALVRPVGKRNTVILEADTGRRLAVREGLSPSSRDKRPLEIGWLGEHEALSEAAPLDLATSGQMLLSNGSGLVEANHYHTKTTTIPDSSEQRWALGRILVDGSVVCLSDDGTIYRSEDGGAPRRVAGSVVAVESGERRPGVLMLGEDGVASFLPAGQDTPIQEFRYSEPTPITEVLWDLSPALDQVAFVKTASGAADLIIKGVGASAPSPRRVRLPAPVCYLRWSDDEQALFAITTESSPILVDIEAGDSVAATGIKGEPVCGCVTGAGRLLCVADDAGFVHCINPSRGEPNWRYHTNTPITVVASSTARNRIAVGYLDGSIDILDGSSGDAMVHIGAGRSCPVEQLRFSPDGFLLASYGSDGQVQLHNTQLGQLAYRCPVGSGPEGAATDTNGVMCLAIKNSGELLVYRRRGNTLQSFDVLRPESLTTIPL